MAYFAKLDNLNIVTGVIVVDDKDTSDESNNIVEQIGITFLKNTFGQDTNWALCHGEGAFRNNYPSIGSIFDEVNDTFILPKPFESWVLNSDFKWEAPIQCPGNINDYYWDESEQNWKLDDDYTV